MTFLTWIAFLDGTRIAVSRAETHGGETEIACAWFKNLACEARCESKSTSTGHAKNEELSLGTSKLFAKLSLDAKLGVSAVAGDSVAWVQGGA